MTVDREQIRRDAERSGHHGRYNHDGFQEAVADHCLALLAELEQAEKERNGLATEALELHTRLAKVPALVEALKDLLEQAERDDKQIHNEWGAGEAEYVENPLLAKAREALAEWERE